MAASGHRAAPEKGLAHPPCHMGRLHQPALCIGSAALQKGNGTARKLLEHQEEPLSYLPQHCGTFLNATEKSLANSGAAVSAALGLRLQAITQGNLMNTHVTHPRTTNLVESAAADGSFNTLRKALDAAGLTNMLKGNGPYTIFAPNDEAFSELPQGVLENWLKPENKEELVSVLKHHVLPSRASAADVGALSRPKMMGGRSTQIDKDGDRLTIDGAHLIGTEITSANGVIHTIDAVILPPRSTVKH